MSSSMFTHKGWFLIAPVYFNYHGVEVVSRSKWLDWWLTLNVLLVISWCYLLDKLKLIPDGQEIDALWLKSKLTETKYIEVYYD